jgi:ribonuclease BN (tRNA processing enzyme)
MKLTVLGCAGTFPGSNSGCSSYLVEHDGFRMMIDCGNGATGALQRHGDLLDLDAVVLSHLHPDHFIDLLAYAYARFYHPRGRAPMLPVWGPAGTRDRLGSAVESKDAAWLDQVYSWQTFAASDFEIGPFSLEGRLMAHPIECYGLRVTAGGKTLAYSADTGPCDALIQTASACDLFLCEASFIEAQDNPPGVHMTGRQAGLAATEADVRSLLLTHLVAWHDEAVVLAEAKETFSGDLQIARSGTTYAL